MASRPLAGARPCPPEVAEARYLSGPKPRILAHRGGAQERPENTIEAFAHAAALGSSYIETDLWATRDGVLVLHHDPTVERTTDGTGAIADLTWSELERLDAGYRWTDAHGATPFRGRGLRIPSLRDALAVDPGLRFNIEIKPHDPGVVRAVWSAIERDALYDRVLVAAAHGPNLEQFRALAHGRVATSASTGEAAAFLARSLVGGPWRAPPFRALQVPYRHYGLPVVTRRFVHAAHRWGIEVHVWTINDTDMMRRLVGLGVDGLVTDVPSVALELFGKTHEARP